MPSLPEDFDDLVAEIAVHLELDAQFVVHLEPWDVDTIGDVRRAGRAAARRIGHRVVTHQTGPKERQDGRVVVIVALRGDDLSQDDQDRYDQRTTDVLGRIGKNDT